MNYDQCSKRLLERVPISEYSLNATIFHYVLAIRTENYKIQDKWPDWLLALQLVVSNASMNMWGNSRVNCFILELAE